MLEHPWQVFKLASHGGASRCQPDSKSWAKGGGDWSDWKARLTENLLDRFEMLTRDAQRQEYTHPNVARLFGLLRGHQD